MCDLTDPYDLLHSDEDLAEAKRKLKAFENGDRSFSDEELWQAQKIVKSMTHPGTGEKTFWPGRMSAFVIANTPTALGMIVYGSRSLQAAAFWQWMNQSVNMACNFVNRSTPDYDAMKLAQSYGLAVGCSVSLAVGAGKLIEVVPALKAFGLIVPYLSVITASTANMIFARIDEWQTGVPIFDQDGKERGISANAGTQAIVETLLTRAYLVPVACLIIPPLGIRAANRILPRIMGFRPIAIGVETAIIAGCIYSTLPAFLAIQPQTMSIPKEKLEPEFQELTTESGQPVTHFSANKGL